MKKLICLLLLMLMVSPALAADQDTVTQRDLRTGVRDLLGGIETSNTWTDVIIDRTVMMGCREFATFIGIPAKVLQVTTTGVSVYALPSDFLKIRGVTKYNEEADKRERRLLYRALRTSNEKEAGFGDDSDLDHPAYYTITGADSTGTKDRGWYLQIDPPEEEADRDTLYIYYYAQATELTATDTISNIPYHGFNLVVYSAYLNCLFKGRENPTIAAVIPTVEKQYTKYFDLLVRDQSDLDFDPAIK